VDAGPEQLTDLLLEAHVRKDALGVCPRLVAVLVTCGDDVLDALPVVVRVRRTCGGEQLGERQHDSDEQTAASERPVLEAPHRLTPSRS
jgi:hypothetical protein